MPTSSRLFRRLAVVAAALGAGALTASGGVASASAPAVVSPGLTAGCTWAAHQLPLPAGWTKGTVTAINDGYEVGSATDPQGTYQPLMWHNGQVAKLPSVPGGAQAEAISPNGSFITLTHLTAGSDKLLQLNRVWPAPAGAVSSIAIPGDHVRAPSITNNRILGVAHFATGSPYSDGAPDQGVYWELPSPEFVTFLADGFTDPRVITREGLIAGQTSDTGSANPPRAEFMKTYDSVPVVLAGLDQTKISDALDADNAYIVGTGTLRDGTTGPARGPILWNNDHPQALPGTLKPAAVNQHGTVGGNTAGGQALVWNQGHLWTMPSLSTTPGTDVLDKLTEDGRAFGESNHRPVEWICS